MHYTVRPATPDDHARLIQIAAEGDFNDCDSRYLSFITDVGRLLVSTIEGTVIGFAGTVSAADVAMVTDLFIATDARGRGAGGRLLTELLAGRSFRMTFSAQHPAALAAYARAGMTPRGRMLYLSGRASGGGRQLQPAAWAHDRSDLVGYLTKQGAIVTADAIVLVGGSEVEVLRLDASNAIAECQRLLGAFDAGTPLRMYVPEQHSLADWLLAHDFVVTDHDVLCTSDGVALPPTLAALHPGLS